MRKRRALSTVIGAVFAIIALTSTVTYISYSMGILNNYNNSVLTKNQQLSDVNKENFRISSVTVPNGKLNITVANTSSLPINFTKIWIQNTTTTDWVRSYTPTNNFVAPGGVLTNIGQKIPAYINSANSYNVKLVTSRGNTQQFNLNSANTAPLNIQLLSVPSTVVSNFKTEVLMVVTNNQTGTLVNVVPNTPTQTAGSATCTVGAVSPTKYNILLPGSTAIFKWDVTVTGNINGATCTLTLTQPLQNGYAQTVNTVVTLTQITFTSTTLAQNAGILTINYTTFQWTQGNSWSNSWSVPHNSNTVLSMKLSNNNQTSTFYLGKFTQVAFQPASAGTNNNQFYIVNSTILSPLSVKKYDACNGFHDYCISIPPGGTVTINFAADAPGGNNIQQIGSSTQYFAMMLVFGKFAPSQGGVGTSYAQTIPYIAVQGT